MKRHHGIPQNNNTSIILKRTCTNTFRSSSCNDLPLELVKVFKQAKEYRTALPDHTICGLLVLEYEQSAFLMSSAL